MISKLAWPMAAVNSTHAHHLLLTGINKNLIWGNYEKPTHYAIWFMFWHVAIIGLMAEKPSFPELYSLCFSCRPSQSPSLLPRVWSSNCLKTYPQVWFMTLQTQPELRCDGHRDLALPLEMVLGYYKKVNSDLSIKNIHPNSPLPLTCSLWPLWIF